MPSPILAALTWQPDDTDGPATLYTYVTQETLDTAPGEFADPDMADNVLSIYAATSPGGEQIPTILRWGRIISLTRYNA